MPELMPPPWLIRAAVGAVWVYEGLWCKLLDGDARQREIVLAVPRVGPRFGVPFLKVLGAFETGLGLWAWSGALALPCALTQTGLLVVLNANGLVWARKLIHDPGGMIVKNFAFLLLVWVAAGLPR